MANRNITFPVATAVPGSRGILGVFLAANYIPDISKNSGQVVTVHLAIGVTADSIIEYTLDGTKYHSFLNGVVVKADSGFEKQITIRQGDELNFRSKVAVELDYCYVDLV